MHLCNNNISLCAIVNKGFLHNVRRFVWHAYNGDVVMCHDWPTHTYTHMSGFYHWLFHRCIHNCRFSRVTWVGWFAPWTPLSTNIGPSRPPHVDHLFRSSITSLHVFLGLPLDLPSTSISVHLLTQSSFTFLCTCPNHLSLLLHTSPVASIPSRDLNLHLCAYPLITPHIHVIILISVVSSLIHVLLSWTTFHSYKSYWEWYVIHGNRTWI
jgi:hypothetical protein